MGQQSLPKSPQFSRYVLFGIFYCPTCGARKRVTLRRTIGKPSFTGGKIPAGVSLNERNACPGCRENMWLEKVIDSLGRILLDNSHKIHPDGRENHFLN